MAILSRAGFLGTAALVSVGLLGTHLAAGVAQAQSRAELPPVALPEIPNAVAVADSGLAVASLHDRSAAAIVSPDGVVLEVALGCQPTDIAVTPAGDWAWAVCWESSALQVINVVTHETLVASIAPEQSVALEYVPARHLLVIGGGGGQITTISVRDLNDYQVLSDRKVGTALSALTVAPAGTVGFAATTPGTIVRFAIDSPATATLPMSNPGTYVTSLTMSPDGTTLYAGAGEQTAGTTPAVLLALSPATGKTLQRSVLPIDPSIFGSVLVAAGYRTMYVGTALGADVGGALTGVFAVPLSDDGRMREPTGLVSGSPFASALALSEDAHSLVAGATDSTLVRSAVTDTPYTPRLAITASIKARKLVVTGTSAHLPAGTQVTVYAKRLAVPGATFIAQPREGAIRLDGTIAWKAPIALQRAAVYVVAGSTKSATVRTPRR